MFADMNLAPSLTRRAGSLCICVRNGEAGGLMNHLVEIVALRLQTLSVRAPLLRIESPDRRRIVGCASDLVVVWHDERARVRLGERHVGHAVLEHALPGVGAS